MSSRTFNKAIYQLSYFILVLALDIDHSASCFVLRSSSGFNSYEKLFLPITNPPRSASNHFVSARPVDRENEPNIIRDEIDIDARRANNNLIRLNKVFKATHSRREADKLIESGRVEVNGIPVSTVSGFKGVIPFVDVVTLDGKVVRGWEKINAATVMGNTHSMVTNALNKEQLEIYQDLTLETMKSQFEYIKYWKPRGVICTTDQAISNNIISEITQNDGFRPKNRVFPIGRLDKDTSGMPRSLKIYNRRIKQKANFGLLETGLILLTSDGRIPNAVLRGEHKQPKTYEVTVDRSISDKDIQKLRDGVLITTQAQRDGKRIKSLTAATLPAQVKRISAHGSARNSTYSIEVTIVEGRNRQIRKMLEALNYTVKKLHRVDFMGISLKPLKGPGAWTFLTLDEIKLLREALVLSETIN